MKKSNAKRKVDGRFLTLVLLRARIVFLCVLGGLCASCAGGHTNPLTVAPSPVKPRVVSDWAKRNVIDFDEKGVIVRADYVRVYKALYADFGKKLPVSERPGSIDDGITKEGPDRYHVTFEVRDRFDDLKFYERNSVP